MKKILITIFVYILLLNTKVSGQITVGPEVGISYYPHSIRSLNLNRIGPLYYLNEIYKENPSRYGARTRNSKPIDLILGIAAQLRIHEKWLVNTRMIYTNRGVIQWEEEASFADQLFMELKQKDFNIEFSFLYEVHNRIHIGFGPSILKKIDTNFTDHSVSINLAGSPYVLHYEIWNYGLNAVLSYDMNRYNINLFYVRKFKDEAIPFLIHGKSRLDLTVSMKLFGYKHGKK